MRNYFASKSVEIEAREIRNSGLIRQIASECMVLLENKGVLPFDAGKVALFGNGVRKTIKGGTGSGDVNTRDNITIEQGFKNAGAKIVSLNWLDRQEAWAAEDMAAYYKWVDEKAEKEGLMPLFITFDHPYKETYPLAVTEEDCVEADAAVYVVSRICGEGCDCNNEKGDYLFYDQELDNIRMLASKYEKVVLVLNIGNLMELTALKEIEGLGAVLLMTQLGDQGGDALADVLYGKSVPSGKTTDTWARAYADYPSSANFSHYGSVHDEEYNDDIYVGYRYFDSFGVEPLYPFGYGLSYTTFSYDTETVSVSDDQVEICVRVKNTGDQYSGKEIIQVYVSAPQGLYAKPYQVLAAFAKTKELRPGEEQKLVITFSMKEVAYYNEAEAAWMLDQGNYIVRVGRSSADTNASAVIKMQETVKVSQCRNVMPLDQELERIVPDAEKFEELEEDTDLPVCRICADVFDTEIVTYQGKREEYTTDRTEVLTAKDVAEGRCTVEELVAQLSIEELADLCSGTLRADSGSVVGNASALVPGAAGDTSSMLMESRGIKGMIMADGPAGIRLTPHFKTDLEGNLLPGGDTLGGITEAFDSSFDETNSIDYYQYCTAIPIGWGLAQSWNTDMVCQIGEMIGSEMVQFGVDLWLAPAQNIHRNPLCGRNFEYYSEDPMISGRIAGAMTKGVQSCKGKGVCVKHFAVNNQENNRYFVNAHVSERALREIYLKSFEISVRESQPISLMTSYNLINGIHAANQYDMIQSVLRDEWKFDGFVMTDWFSSQEIAPLQGKYKPIYPISSSTGCAKAGNDVQMPGCRKNVEDLIVSVKEDREVDGIRVTKADLQQCAAKVIKAAIETM